jgi:arginyl-tRNA synthetase
MINFRLHIIERLVDEVGSEGVDESVLEIPPDSTMGDYAFPCFLLSKRLRKSPQQLAEWLSKKLTPDKIIKEVRHVGPYLNFFVNKSCLAENILKQVFEEKELFGSSVFGRGKTVVIEYPSPNTNKPLHLGHLRNISTGVCISNIFESQGYAVKRVNLNNDRGIHICKSMLAYQKWGEGKTPESEHVKSDHFVGDFYVMFSKKEKELPELEEEAREMLRKWEAGDKQVRKLWELMNGWAFKGFDETYRLFGAPEFDKTYFESETYEEGRKIVLDALKKGIVQKKEDGAIVIDLEEEGLGEKVLIRSDGTTVYITQDLYTALSKQEDFNFYKSIYVVATEQSYHFKVLFTVLKKFGYSWADGCYHFAYGMVNLPEGRMKSREGTVVDADDLIHEMEALAREEILKRHESLDESKLNERARIIALGSLKFYLLKIDAIKDMTFNPKESISFEGDTGPYLQYTHARACSILRKAAVSGIEPEPNIIFSLLSESSENELISLLSQFPEKVREACDSYKPHLIAQHLLSIGRAFNEFYHSSPCLQEENESLMLARLLLIDCTRIVLEKGLNLLGIEAPVAM